MDFTKEQFAANSLLKYLGGQYLPEWQVKIMISMKKSSISIPHLGG